MTPTRAQVVLRAVAGAYVSPAGTFMPRRVAAPDSVIVAHSLANRPLPSLTLIISPAATQTHVPALLRDIASAFVPGVGTFLLPHKGTIPTIQSGQKYTHPGRPNTIASYDAQTQRSSYDGVLEQSAVTRSQSSVSILQQYAAQECRTGSIVLANAVSTAGQKFTPTCHV